MKTYQNYIAWLHLDSQSHKPWSKKTHTETESQKRHHTQTNDPCMSKIRIFKNFKNQLKKFSWHEMVEMFCKMYILVSLKQQYHLWNRKIESSPQCLRLSCVYTYTLYTVYQFNKKSMKLQAPEMQSMPLMTTKTF